MRNPHKFVGLILISTAISWGSGSPVCTFVYVILTAWKQIAVETAYRTVSA